MVGVVARRDDNKTTPITSKEVSVYDNGSRTIDSQFHSRSVAGAHRFAGGQLFIDSC